MNVTLIKNFKLIIIILTLFLNVSCIDHFERMSDKSNLDYLIKYINKPLNGIVTDTISYRENMKASFIVLDSRDTIYINNNDIIENISIGDSLYKFKEDNYLYCIKENTKDTLTFWFVKIPNKYRQHELFPEKWKDKWIESSTE